MNILFATTNASLAVSVQRCLTAAGHDVDIEGESAVVLERGRGSELDIVIVDSAMDSSAWRSLTSQLREKRDSIYLVVLGARKSELATAALTLGADDYIPVPFERAELAARMLPAARVRSLLKGARALSRNPGIPETRAWAELEKCTTRELGRMLAVGCSKVKVSIVTGTAVVVELPLALPELQMEVFLFLAAEPSGLSAAAGLLLGSASSDPTMQTEIARELLNTIAGCFKRAALEEELEFTTGLPQDSCRNRMRELNDNAVATKRFGIGWADQHLEVLAVVRPTGRRMLLATKLEEGMVLTDEVRNAGGALLVSSGTRLTLALIKHVQQAVGTRAHVTVASSK